MPYRYFSVFENRLKFVKLTLKEMSYNVYLFNYLSNLKFKFHCAGGAVRGRGREREDLDSSSLGSGGNDSLDSGGR